MAQQMKAARRARRIDWMRWLHDPRHWEHFYDELATETYAALARELFEGKWPDEAVELAVEAISAKMRAEGVPEDVVLSYREEYFKRRVQLAEIAGEIADVMPDARQRAERARL